MRIGAVLAAGLVAVCGGARAGAARLEAAPGRQQLRAGVRREALTIKGSGSHCQGRPGDPGRRRARCGCSWAPTGGPTPELRVSVAGRTASRSPRGGCRPGAGKGTCSIPIDRGRRAARRRRGLHRGPRRPEHPAHRALRLRRVGSLRVAARRAARAGSSCCRPWRTASASASRSSSGSWLLAFVAVLVGGWPGCWRCDCSCARSAGERAGRATCGAYRRRGRWCALVAFLNALRLAARHPALPRAGRDGPRRLRPVPRRDRRGPGPHRRRPVLARAAGIRSRRTAVQRGGRPPAGSRHPVPATTTAASTPSWPIHPASVSAGRDDRDLLPAAALLRAGVRRLPRLAVGRSAPSALADAAAVGAAGRPSRRCSRSCSCARC